MGFIKDVLVMAVFFVVVVALFVASHIVGFILSLFFIVYIVYEIYKEGRNNNLQ